MKNLKVLSKSRILDNLSKFKEKKICAMVKCNAYGHGLEEVVKIVENEVDYFGVVNVEEGKRVRAITSKPIIICAKTNDLETCKKYKLEMIIDNLFDLKNCLDLGLQNSCHLKLNCGMNRYGVKNFENIKLINKFLEEKKIKLQTISTHFPFTENRKKTIENYQLFQNLRNEISQNVPICFGGSNIINYPFNFDIVRVGIAMYGYGQKDVKPVMSIKSYISKIFFVKSGEYIGYGKKHKVKKDSLFAVVPVGYGDGVRRGLSGQFYVEINGKKYKTVANICMDAMFVEVDKMVKVFDEVVVMHNADDFAEKLNTISYEILTGLSNFRGQTVIE